MSIENRFSGIARLYGRNNFEKITRSSMIVVGIGGVGSWIAEGLARTGVGKLILIDLDDVAESNINRQLHALTPTIGKSKIEVMKQRIEDINSSCNVVMIEDFVTADNVFELVDTNVDVIIDAIDSVSAKSALIAHARRNKTKVITIGGAGGQIDPSQIQIGDLAKTKQDPLLAKVRSELRRKYKFSKNPKRRFGVESVYSTEQLRYPTASGDVSFEKQQLQGSGKMDCSTGFGATMSVTCAFGMHAVSRAIAFITK